MLAADFDQIVIVDFETTGVGPNARPVEVAWIQVDHDLNEIARASSLVNPGIPIEPEASAVNGGVEFTLGSPLDATDSVDLETVNGGVTLKLPSESKATIAARCVNGGVNVDSLDISREEQATDFDKRRRLNGTMNGGGASVKLNTTNGGIHLSRSAGNKTS